MKSLLLLTTAVLGLIACGRQPEAISIQVFPAVLAADASATAATWDTLRFPGNQRSVAGTYLVRPEPLFTEWNILAFRTAQQPDGSLAIATRLNERGAARLSAFTSRAENLKHPLVVKIGDRWADLIPVLAPMNKRITLYGFTDTEAATLRHYVDNR